MTTLWNREKLIRDLFACVVMLCAAIAGAAGVSAATLLEPVAENVNWAQPSPLFAGVSLGDSISEVDARLECIEKSRGANEDGERVSCLLRGAAGDASREYEALNVQAAKDGTVSEVVVLRLFPAKLTPDAISALRAEYAAKFGPPTLMQWSEEAADAEGLTATRQLCWGRQCRCSPGRCVYTDKETGQVQGKPLEFSTWDPKGDAAMLTLRDSPFIATNETNDANAPRWVDAVTVLVRRLGEQP